MLVMPVQVDKPEDHVSDKLAALRNEGPPVAAPVDPDEEADKDAEEDAEAWEPTETEMAEAFEAFTALPPLPEHASA